MTFAGSVSLPTPGSFAMVALAGGVLGLDATAVLQAMLSQPIVTGPIVGALLGNPETGLAVGAGLQLLFAANFPLGASVPPDGCSVATALTAAVVWTRPGYAVVGEVAYPLTAAVLLGGPLAYVGGRADIWIRNWNARWGGIVDSSLERGDPRGIDRALWAGVTSYFVKGALVTAGLCVAATAVLLLLSDFRTREPYAQIPYWIELLLPAGALGLLVRAYSERLFVEEGAAGVAALTAVLLSFVFPHTSPLLVIAAGTMLGIGVWVWSTR